MKAPERVLSTPRLLAVMLTVTACYGFIVDKIGATEFLSLASLALAFFFQQRKPENQEPKDLPPTNNTWPTLNT